MAQPQLSKLTIWKNFEKEALTVLELALIFLRRKRNISSNDDEPKLNRALYLAIMEATKKLSFNYSIVPEGQNPPYLGDSVKALREDKRPDFYWTIMDHTETNPSKFSRQFTVECKRLGKPTSSKWVLTEQYVVEGILRFIRINDGYGKGAESGAMVGYVQNMNLPDLLTDVNNNAMENSIPKLTISFSGWRFKKVSNLNHTFKRRFKKSDLPPKFRTHS